MMTKKRLWVVSEFYYPIVTSTGYYMTEIAEYLATKKGLDVHVISTCSLYNDSGNYDFSEFEKHNNVCINRVNVGNLDKNSFLKRILRLLITSFRMFFKIMRSVKKGDDLLVVTNPAFIILLMPLVKFIKKINYTLLVHDIFPENLVAIGKLSKKSIIYKLLKYTFDKAYKRADRCISIGRDMSRVIIEKTKSNSSIIYIPNWADINDVYPKKKEEANLYKQLNNKNFTIQFAGNLGHAQGLDNILNAISLIQNINIHFLFVGSGAKYDQIKEFGDRNSNVSVAGFIDRSFQNDFLNACDVSIVTLSDGMYGLGVPSKAYNIMASGKPILMIGETDSEIALCVKEYELGWVVEPNNPVALKEAIELIYNKRNALEDMMVNNRAIAENVFSKNIILEKYYALYS